MVNFNLFSLNNKMPNFKKFEIKHSTKSIPNAKNKEYKEALIEKTQRLVRRMRFNAKFFDEYDTYGFKTNRSPKPVDYLQAFEGDLIKMVQNVEFRTTRSRFQTELLKIVRDVGKCKNLIVPSDKTANFYEVPVGEYRKL